MTSQQSRRAFLRGAFRQPDVMRPFGASSEEFSDSCTRCGDCVSACPEAILINDKDGFPQLDPSLGACSFCADCIEACGTGALAQGRDWPWRAQVGDTCLSMAGVFCRTCEDQCDAQAIRFRLQTGGRSVPAFDTATCTGCGGCASACPVGAIQFTQVTQPKETATC